MNEDHDLLEQMFAQAAQIADSGLAAHLDAILVAYHVAGPDRVSSDFLAEKSDTSAADRGGA